MIQTVPPAMHYSSGGVSSRSRLYPAAAGRKGYGPTPVAPAQSPTDVILNLRD